MRAPPHDITMIEVDAMTTTTTVTSQDTETTTEIKIASDATIDVTVIVIQENVSVVHLATALKTIKSLQEKK